MVLTWTVCMFSLISSSSFFLVSKSFVCILPFAKLSWFIFFSSCSSSSITSSIFAIVIFSTAFRVYFFSSDSGLISRKSLCSISCFFSLILLMIAIPLVSIIDYFGGKEGLFCAICADIAWLAILFAVPCIAPLWSVCCFFDIHSWIIFGIR